MDRLEKYLHREAELQRRYFKWHLRLKEGLTEKQLFSAKVICWCIIGIIICLICSTCNPAYGNELPIIKKAAIRNKCVSDDYLLLLAIRKAENGRSGCEFGVKHPRAWDTNLDTQAGWAAVTIVKHHKRFGSGKVTIQFINSLADRYCPKSCDFIGNRNWKKNVRFWFEKFKREGVETCEK